MEQAQAVKQLVAEIAAASKEQSQGIEQINKAVSEMEKVVQSNAANAEEAAASTEELNGQAEELRALVNTVNNLISGAKKAVTLLERERHGYSRSGEREEYGQKRADSQPRYLGHNTPLKQAKELNPESVIPLDNDDFKDF